MRKVILTVVALLAMSGAADACGWYLLSPPLRVTWPTSMRVAAGERISEEEFNRHAYNDVEAPLSKWQQDGEFETLKECQAKEAAERQNWFDASHDGVFSKDPDAHRYGVNLFRASSKIICVASDDPRLGR